MNLEKINDLMKNGNGHLQVPVEFQLGIFGLDSVLVKQLAQNNAKGLDIGCGNGSLVKNLMKRGVNFEGMDSHAPDEEYFIRQNILGMKPMEGAIPRRNEQYDIVVAFQNIMLNRAFTIGGVIRDPTRNGGIGDIEDHRSRVQQGQYIFYEGARVVKPNGRFLIYPEAKRVDEVIGTGMLRMQGIEVYSENVGRDNARKYMEWELGQYDLNPEAREVCLAEKYFEDWGLYKRTVVTKKK